MGPGLSVPFITGAINLIRLHPTLSFTPHIAVSTAVASSDRSNFERSIKTGDVRQVKMLLPFYLRDFLSAKVTDTFIWPVVVSVSVRYFWGFVKIHLTK